MTLLACKAAGARLAEGLLQRYPDSLKRLISIDDTADFRSSLPSFQALASSGRAQVDIVQPAHAVNTILQQDPPDVCLAGRAARVRRGALLPSSRSIEPPRPSSGRSSVVGWAFRSFHSAKRSTMV